MNDIDSPKLGGGRRPHSFKVVGASCPHCPPPPDPASLVTGVICRHGDVKSKPADTGRTHLLPVNIVRSYLQPAALS